MIYGVLTAINGGSFTNDDQRKTDYEEVENKLAGAINFVILQQYYLGIKEDNIREFPANFYASYEIDVLYDPLRERKYSVIPVKIFSITKNRGIRAITSLIGDFALIQTGVEELAHNKYYEGSFVDEVLFYPLGANIYYQNLPDTVNKLVMVVVEALSEIGENDELPIPAGSENDVMDYLVKFFSTVRQTPTDNTNNNITQPFTTN